MLMVTLRSVIACLNHSVPTGLQTSGVELGGNIRGPIKFFPWLGVVPSYKLDVKDCVSLHGRCHWWARPASGRKYP